MNLRPEKRDAEKMDFVAFVGAMHHWMPPKNEGLRKFVRFRTSDCVLVDYSQACFNLGEILDISLGGIHFRCLQDHFLPESGTLSIFVSTRGLSVVDIPFEKVWTSTESYPSTGKNISTLHVGVQFGITTDGQHRTLRSVIENHTDADPEG